MYPNNPNRMNERNRPDAERCHFPPRIPVSSGQLADASTDTVDTLRKNGNLFTSYTMLSIVSREVQGKEFDLECFQKAWDYERELGSLVQNPDNSEQFFYDRRHWMNVLWEKEKGKSLRAGILSGNIKPTGHGKAIAESEGVEKEVAKEEKKAKSPAKLEKNEPKSRLREEPPDSDFSKFINSQSCGGSWNRRGHGYGCR